MAAAVLVISGLLQVVMVAGTRGGRTAFGPALGADFAAYYIAGSIIDRFGPGRLYDLELQAGLYSELFPGVPPGSVPYYLYAPWVAAALVPLARLPYTIAYLAWEVLNLALYATAFRLIWGPRRELAGVDRLTAVLLALSWAPFLMEMLFGGQSTLAVFAVAAAVASDRAGRPVAAGAALALAAFKPTLAAPAVLMLLVARRWRTLAGFLAGSAALLGISWWGGVGFVRAVLAFARVRAQQPDAFVEFKYIDTNSAIHLLAGHGWAVDIGATLPAVAALVWLAARWWRDGLDWDRAGEAAWSRTLAWSPVLIPHLGIYDATLVMPAVVLALHMSNRSGRPAWPLAWPVGATYLAAMVSQAIARRFGLQVLTLALVWLAVRVTRTTDQAVAPR
jgi:hypothetical protein